MIVGFIGLGTMGGPMAANVLKGGHRLVVSDVEPAAEARLTAHGATAARTPTRRRPRAEAPPPLSNARVDTARLRG
jgi:3-hydroxyisobutyrate dehydrogenase-like beta-hydroxyacid dehydrogenase